MMSRLGAERGWPASTRARSGGELSARGALLAGDPAAVLDKTLLQQELLGHRRFLMQMSVGTMPHAAILRSIALLGTRVAPAVRSALGGDGRRAA